MMSKFIVLKKWDWRACTRGKEMDECIWGGRLFGEFWRSAVLARAFLQIKRAISKSPLRKAQRRCASTIIALYEQMYYNMHNAFIL